MKLLLLLLYPIILIGLIAVLVRKTSLQQTIKKNWKSILLFSFISFVVLCLFIVYRMKMEDFIPYRDYAGFYRSALELIQAFDKCSFSDFFLMIYKSMNYSEYSYFAELFLVLPLILIGNSYSRFILAMVVCFVVPLTIFVYVVGLHFSIIKPEKKVSCIAFMISIILFSMNLMPTIYGYVGSAGLLFIAVIFYLSYEEMSLDRIDVEINIVIGILLLLIVLIRRWFAYTVVAYFVVEGVYYLILLINDKNIKRFTQSYLKLFIQGCSALVPMLLFFFPLVKTFLSTNYAVVFDAAIKGTPLQQIYSFVNNYSPIVVVISVFSLFSKKYRSVSCKLITSIVIIFILFTRVQDFGTHHYYMTNVQMILLMLMGLDTLSSYSGKLSIFVLVGYTILYVINFYSMGISKISFPGSRFLISEIHVPIRETPEREKIEMLSHFLGNEPQDYEYAYVLSASYLLNEDLLRNALLPEIINATPWMERTRVWDQRDGIPEKFFQYTYIVVTDPIQYNAAPEDQRVVGILADGMLHDEELRSYYRLEWEFEYLDMTVFVYKRIEDIDASIVERYSNIFKQYYPEQPELYEFEK